MIAQRAPRAECPDRATPHRSPHGTQLPIRSARSVPAVDLQPPRGLRGHQRRRAAGPGPGLSDAGLARAEGDEHHLGELFPRVGFIVTTLTGTNRAVVRFYNQRETAEQWIKEGKAATNWTRLSCHRFRANEVRLLLGVIAYNLGNLLRRLVLPAAIQSWSLTSLQQRLFKTGGRLIRHARYFVLQLAESHLTPTLFRQMLGRIERLAWHPT